MKNPSFGAFSPFPKANQECKEEKQREESNRKKSKKTEDVGHILITFWSPFYTYYRSFLSLGIQEFNASNGVRIGAEMKKLWSFEDNCTKLERNFATPCETEENEFRKPCETKAEENQFRNPLRNFRKHYEIFL